MSTSALDAALRYRAAGFSVIPIKTGGKKSPGLKSWKEFQDRVAEEGEVRSWLADAESGVGVVCGPASGNLAVFDFEFADYFDAWAALVEDLAPGLLARLPRAASPGKGDSRGRHVYARSETPVRGRKLAATTPEDAEARTGDAAKVTAIEVRGSGHYVLAPGCPAGCHESGRLYEWLPGPDVEQTPTLSADEMLLLISCAKALDVVKEDSLAVREPPGFTDAAADGEKPGAAFNRTASWADILTPHGWRRAGSRGGVDYWTRPGKGGGVSASTGYQDGKTANDLLYVFSSNAAPLEPDTSYSKFGAYTELNCGGSFARATDELGRAGYGEPPKKRAAAAVAIYEDDGPPPEDERPAAWPRFVLPAALEEYADQLARAMSCPVDFPASAMIAIAGAAAGASRCIEVRRTWRESGRVWLAVVGWPGTGKSPSIDQLMLPLEDHQNLIQKAWKKEKDDYDLEVLQYEANCKAFSRRQEGEGAAERPSRPVAPKYQHIYTDNVTTEALVPMLAENPRGFLVALDELAGWINSMNQYKGGKGADRQFWLSAWNGKTVKVDRKSSREQGSLIAKKPFMCVLGGIQPDKLCDLADARGQDDGLLDRFLFVVPPRTPWATKIGEPPSDGAERMWVGCLGTMWGWKMQERPEDDTKDPVVLGLTPGGLEVSDAWYDAHAREVNAPDFPGHLYGPWSKLRAYYFRFALIVHCLRVACDEIPESDVDEDSCERAAALVNYFKSHLKAAHSRMGFRQEDKLAERAMDWIRSHGGRAKPSELVRAKIVKKSSEAEQLLRDLADRGLGRVEQPPAGKAGRPPSPAFVAWSSEPSVTLAAPFVEPGPGLVEGSVEVS